MILKYINDLHDRIQKHIENSYDNYKIPLDNLKPHEIKQAFKTDIDFANKYIDNFLYKLNTEYYDKYLEIINKLNIDYIKLYDNRNIGIHAKQEFHHGFNFTKFKIKLYKLLLFNPNKCNFMVYNKQNYEFNQCKFKNKFGRYCSRHVNKTPKHEIDSFRCFNIDYLFLLMNQLLKLIDDDVFFKEELNELFLNNPNNPNQPDNEEYQQNNKDNNTIENETVEQTQTQTQTQ